jgi:beta-N-acetylhexosaminidase
MAPNDSRAPRQPSVGGAISLRPLPRLLAALLAVVALGAAIAGAIVGADQGDEAEQAARPPEPSGRPTEERAAPSRLARLAERLPLERKVAQLFLLGVRDADLNARILGPLRRIDLGGIVLSRPPSPIPRHRRDISPLVLAVQDGGEFNTLKTLPPRSAPADLRSARAAKAEATETARALRSINLTGVLGPVVDVGSESGSALGARVYSDDPEQVSAYAQAVVGAYRRGRLFAAVKHFPGLGAADQSTAVGPASVGLDLAQLRERDLIPFRAAIEAGVPGVLLSHALYPMNDFTKPASLSRAVATDLLRDELHFGGVAIADDLADPAVSFSYSVPDAAVTALEAGADMVYVSGSPDDQRAGYDAVLRAARRGDIPMRRIDQALLRVLDVKRDYGLIR